jgi:large subunit ribosomal protein L13
MRATLIVLGAGQQLFQAPVWTGRAPYAQEPYILQPAGAASAYAVPEAAYVQYAVPQQESALPSPANAALVLLVGAALGVAAASYSAPAPVATLGVAGEEDLEAGAESDDDTPTPGRLSDDYVSTALANELKFAGLEMPVMDSSTPFFDYNKTAHPGHDAIQKANKQWLIVDAEGMRLGRMASEIARRLIGKDKVTYYPGADVGDMVVVVNAEKVIVTGKKYDQKFYRRHSGRPGGMKIETFGELQQRIPERIIEKAVWGMLPKNAYGRELFRHLKVYKGPSHPHEAQQPVEMEWAYKAKAMAPDSRKMAFLSVLGMEEEEEVTTPVAMLAVGGTEEFSLTNIGPLPGANHRKKRKGRGIAAGQGKTCGFGDDGQKARSGRGVRYDADGTKFAGGSNKYYRMDSRKDHNRPFGPGHQYTKYSLIKLADLNSLDDGAEVTVNDLLEKGVVTKNSKRPLKKVVGGSELTTKNLTVKAHGFTESAKSAIENLGGKVVLLSKLNKELTDAAQKDKVVAALGMMGWGIRGERVTKFTTARRKRQLRIRKKVSGTTERPRLSVHRSNNHMYAQIINDDGVEGKPGCHILCGASTLTPELREALSTEGNSANKDAAFKVGELLAKRAKAMGVEKVSFDRSGYQYHGRVAAVAEGARAGGLVF